MEKDYQALAKEFKEMIGKTTEETEFDIVIDGGVELVPQNDLGTFYHLEEVVDFCRVKKLCCYVSLISVPGKCVVRMY